MRITREEVSHGGYVPQARPRYSPPGTHRCEKCNAIVRDGAECGCYAEHKREPWRMRVIDAKGGSVLEVLICPRCNSRYTEPSGVEKGMCSACHQREEARRRRKAREPEYVERECCACGKAFLRRKGLTTRYCPECKEERMRRHPLSVCSGCGAEYRKVNGSDKGLCQECSPPKTRLEYDCKMCGIHVVSAYKTKSLYCDECRSVARGGRNAT